MQVTILASGSSGNCSIVSDGENHLLIDAGISLRRITQGLRALGLSPSDLSAALITHEHSDHVSGLPMLLKHHPMPVYATRPTVYKLRGMFPEAQEALLDAAPWDSFKIKNTLVTAFPTPHDSAASCGFRVEGEGVFALATDTGCVTEELIQGLSGASCAVIEANHDYDLLCQGRYPAFLKRRILADTGHLENKSCAALAKTLAEGGTQSIILAHLSRENNRPELPFAAVSAALAGCAVQVYVAPQSGLLTVPVKGGSHAFSKANSHGQNEGALLHRRA